MQLILHVTTHDCLFGNAKKSFPSGIQEVINHNSAHAEIYKESNKKLIKNKPPSAASEKKRKRRSSASLFSTELVNHDLNTRLRSQRGSVVARSVTGKATAALDRWPGAASDKPAQQFYSSRNG